MMLRIKATARRLKEVVLTVSGVVLLMGAQWGDCEWHRRAIAPEEKAFHSLLGEVEEGRACTGANRLRCTYQSVEKLSLHAFPLEKMARSLSELTRKEAEKNRLSSTQARREFQIWFLGYAKRELDFRRHQLVGYRIEPKREFIQDREALKQFLKQEVDSYFSEDRSAQRSPAENPGIEEHWNAVAHFRAELFKPLR